MDISATDRDRMLAYLLAVFMCLTNHVDTLRSSAGVLDYCQWESFNVSCGQDEVIVMQSAVFGRMTLGRCAKVNYGHLGCHVDVMTHMDDRCSGRRNCTVKIYDELRVYSTCPEDVNSYLEASYTCWKLAPAHRDNCLSHHEMPVSGTSGYLATQQTLDRGFGGPGCPWKIKVKPGQRINITLYNFGRAGASSGSGLSASMPGMCYELGTIEDSGKSRRLTVCHEAIRSKQIYTSTGHTLTIQLISPTALRNLGHYVIHYTAVGCPNPTLPHGASIKHEGDDVIVTCNGSGMTRHLTCRGNTLIGDPINCTAGAGWSLGQVFTTDGSFPYGILIIVAIGVALGVFCGGLVLSVIIIYMRRKQAHERPPAEDVEDIPREEKYIHYDPELDPHLARSQDGSLKTLPPQLPPPNGEPEELVFKEPSMGKQTIPYGHVGMIPRPPSDIHSAHRQHIYESPQFS